MIYIQELCLAQAEIVEQIDLLTVRFNELRKELTMSSNDILSVWFGDVLDTSEPKYNITYGNSSTYPTGQVFYYPTSPTPSEIKKQFEDFFNRFWVNRPNTPIISDGKSLPKMNVYETQDGLTIEASIPFASREDVSVVVDPVTTSVSISVEKHQATNKDDRTYHLKEISRTSFKRTVSVDGTKFDIEKSSADFKDGILTIAIPIFKDKQVKKLELK